MERDAICKNHSTGTFPFKMKMKFEKNCGAEKVKWFQWRSWKPEIENKAQRLFNNEFTEK